MASFELFGLELLFNMAAMSILTPKCPSEVDLSHLECSDGFDSVSMIIFASKDKSFGSECRSIEI